MKFYTVGKGDKYFLTAFFQRSRLGGNIMPDIHISLCPLILAQRVLVYQCPGILGVLRSISFMFRKQHSNSNSNII